MIDVCRITRNPEGARNAVLDRDTGALTDDEPTLIFEGPCLLRQARRRTVLSGGAVVEVGDFLAKIPWGAALPAPGDDFEVTASGDPSLLSADMSVSGVESRTYGVARSLALVRRSQGSVSGG